jgi:adenylate cyclase
MQRFLRLTPFKIGLILAFSTVLLVNQNIYFLEIVELQMLDQRFKVRGRIAPGPEVVIAVIDEKSQDTLGRWPWPRSILAKLVDKLTAAGAATIGFDMVFSEPETTARGLVLSLLERSPAMQTESGRVLLQEVQRQTTGDQLLADSFKKSQNVILGFFFHDNLEDIRHLKADEIRKGLEQIAPGAYQKADVQPGADVKRVPHAPAVESNLPMFTETAAGWGYFNLMPDIDGIMRHYPLIIHAGTGYYAPLFLKVLAHYLQEDELSFVMDQYGVQNVRAGNVDIPVDYDGQIIVNYYGPHKTFPHIPIVDILQDKVDPELLKGRIVLVGATGKGIFDLRATPFERIYPGVEINATIIDNVLHDRHLKQPLWDLTFTYAVILILGLLLARILARTTAVTGFLITALAFFTNYMLNQFLFNRGLWVNLVYPSFQILAVYTGITVFNYFTESRQKQFINNAFGQYLSPAVVRRLIDNPNLLNLGGEQKNLTAFFSDVAGFSGISEKLTPIQLVELLNEYLTAMSQIILKYEGTIDKYEGDAIIAFFGAPLDYPDHALRACLVSLEMQDTLARLRETWKAAGRSELRARIGLNTGQMVVGNMGSTFRMDYTIMGDAVNLASRLEGVNKSYGTYVMISEFTYGDVRDFVEVRELDKIRVVGKSDPVRIYELLAKKGELAGPLVEILPQFNRGLECYRNQEWEKALSCFEKILEIDENDGPALAFFERCLLFQTNPPPPNWDGVFAMTSK